MNSTTHNRQAERPDPRHGTFFDVGDVLVARGSVQGMTKGEHYEVIDVHVRNLGMLGRFVEYTVESMTDANVVLVVGNAHLLMVKL